MPEIEAITENQLSPEHQGFIDTILRQLALNSSAANARLQMVYLEEILIEVKQNDPDYQILKTYLEKVTADFWHSVAKDLYEAENVFQTFQLLHLANSIKRDEKNNAEIQIRKAIAKKLGPDSDLPSAGKRENEFVPCGELTIHEIRPGLEYEFRIPKEGGYLPLRFKAYNN
jgi:hypothetical protein